jgi:hypothetical protein
MQSLIKKAALAQQMKNMPPTQKQQYMLNMVRQQQQQNTQQQLRTQPSRVQPSRVQPARGGQPQPAPSGPQGPSMDNFRNFVQIGHNSKVHAGIGNAVKSDQGAALEPGLGAFKSFDDASSRLLAYHTWAYPWLGTEFDEVYIIFHIFRFRSLNKRSGQKWKGCTKSMSCIWMRKRGLGMWNISSAF